MAEKAIGQGDLFRPPPSIRGETTIGGKDLWRCPRRLVWTTDPEDLFLSDAELMAKYGPACDAEGNIFPADTPLVISPDILAMSYEELRAKVLGDFDEANSDSGPPANRRRKA
jgi:hypothetical protein